jgi:hypothetical protein
MYYKRLAVIFSIIISMGSIFIFLSLYKNRPLILQFDSRGPNAHELAYRAIAYDFDDPSICYKIFEHAYEGGGWSGHVAYLRSECLYNLAVKTRNPDYCNDVKAVNTALLLADGSKYTPSNCRKAVLKGRTGTHLIYSFDRDRILREMGYTIEDFNKSNKAVYDDTTYNKFDGHETYLKIMYPEDISVRKEFVRRAKNLPSYKK